MRDYIRGVSGMKAVFTCMLVCSFLLEACGGGTVPELEAVAKDKIEFSTKDGGRVTLILEPYKEGRQMYKDLPIEFDGTCTKNGESCLFRYDKYKEYGQISLVSAKMMQKGLGVYRVLKKKDGRLIFTGHTTPDAEATDTKNKDGKWGDYKK